ncbi:MAG: PIN/TRAM domain-containing protein [Planctomycetaceae bacterium]
MLLLVIRLLYLSICAGVLAAYMQGAVAATIATADGTVANASAYPEFVKESPYLCFYGMLAITQLVTLVDVLVPKKRPEVLTAIYLGLVVGMLLAYVLIQTIIHMVPDGSPMRAIAVMFPLLIMPYVCVSLILQTKDDFRFVIPYVEFSQELRGSRALVVDTSSLIDGRIADVVETQILESRLLVPDFVLSEIQDIADSSDKNRRTRGRRGLEILERLQATDTVDVSVHEDRSTETDGITVDQRIVALAKALGAGVITNDFNLNKVATVQGVPVVNLNDVANALKPRYIPGERLQIRVMKAGESNGQGVGYLDDGTMVVCENADHLIGERLSVTVTSVLQKSEGRMIFGKPSDQTVG